MTSQTSRVEFKRGPLWDFMQDHTRHVDLEGAIRSGKTTAALWKVLYSCVTHPGIAWLICRYSDADTRTKLRPRWAEICTAAGVSTTWNASELRYELPNRATVHAFGLKAQDQLSRYAKLRGLTLAGVYVDQAEELPADLYSELKGRLSQSGQPQQLLLTPNPPPEDSWLAREFPEDNRHRHNRYYRVSIYDNAQNLDPAVIRSLEEAYPLGHMRRGPMILGLRGTAQGTDRPVYGALDPHNPESAAFQRSRHERALAYDPRWPLYEAIDYGKRHPCVVWAQYTPQGACHVLGGLLGQDLYLEDFAPVIQRYRTQWFPDAAVLTCCDPAGTHANPHGIRVTGLQVLRDLGFAPRYHEDSNNPAVRRAMIERLAGYMRRRVASGEAFGVSSDRWLRIDARTAISHRFVADALEAGYVWDTIRVSVGSKQIDRPKKDGWYEHGMNCMEYLEHNFGGPQPNAAQLAHSQTRLKRQQESDPDWPLIAAARQQAHSVPHASRGGY